MRPGGPTPLSGLLLGVTSVCTGFALLYAPALGCCNCGRCHLLDGVLGKTSQHLKIMLLVSAFGNF